MNTGPFTLCAPDTRPPKPRGLDTPAGVGDRMRIAAFAEWQAVHAFNWAAETYDDVPDALRTAWVAQVSDEQRHYRMIVDRMEVLGHTPDERPVSNGLWHALSRCETGRDFCILIASAEERGRLGALSLIDYLAKSDPETADVFRRIAEDEIVHVALAERFFNWTP